MLKSKSSKNLYLPLVLFLKKNYSTIIASLLVVVILGLSLGQSYLLFHTIIELLSIVVAFTVFVITWNAKKILQNQYLYFVGIAYLFIGALDLLHTLTFNGMNVIAQGAHFYGNQFWVATRLLEAATLVLGFFFLNRKKKLNADLIFVSYFVISVLIVLSILYWRIFPICFVEGEGQTEFKIIAEYVIIGILGLAGYFLFIRKKFFDPFAYKLLAFSLIFTVLSEFSFTLYVDNHGILNAIGHLFKLISFYLIYKANIETGFTKPTTLLFNEINESEVRYRTLANNLPVLLFRFDQDFNCSYNNLSAEIKQNNEFTNNLQTAIKVALLKLKNTKQALKESIVLFNGTEKQTFSLDLIIENQDAQAPTFLVLCQDITSLKLAEERLQELNATKDKLFSIIGHDLKNPFTTILASSELIYKAAPKLGVEKVQSLALRSNEAAKSAYSLLENLLNWAMAQTGVLNAKPEEIYIESLLNRLVKSMLPTASLKKIAINIKSHPSHTCFADLNMTETILRNLLSNAIKFSHQGSRIDIMVIEEKNEMRFSVSDQGVGIDEDTLKILLTNEQRLTKDGTFNEKGTGLGLQLCKDFIRLNNGKFNVDSKLGEGTVFEFWMPKAN